MEMCCSIAIKENSIEIKKTTRRQATMRSIGPFTGHAFKGSELSMLERHLHLHV